MSISEALRAEVKKRIDAGESIRGIAAGAGLPGPTLNRFVNDVRTLTLPNVDLLAEYLGLELRARKKPRQSGRG